LSKVFARKEEPSVNIEEVWKQEDSLTVEERRKRYHSQKFVELKDIEPWSLQSKKLKVVEKESKFQVDEELNNKVALWHGDITTLELDAIVNSANESLMGGSGGIEAAIHKAAGPRLLSECGALHGCETGQVKISRGYDLPSTYILHTVGPVDENPEVLEACYNGCLDLLEKNKIKTVAFCAVSTGVFGFPIEPATRIALSTVRRWLETGNNRTKVNLVVFVLYKDRDNACYEQIMPEYFPVKLKLSDNQAKVDLQKE